MAEIETVKGSPSVVRVSGGSSSAATDKGPPVHMDIDGSANVQPGTGVCSVTFDVPMGASWNIERISVSCDSVTTTTFQLFKNDDSLRHRIEYTANGNNAMADESQPIYASPACYLIAVWLDASDLNIDGNPTNASILMQVTANPV